MSKEQIAEDIYNEIFFTLFDSESDVSEEILISILTKKLAIKQVEMAISYADLAYAELLVGVLEILKAKQ